MSTNKKDAHDLLQRTLGHAYAIERELGRGGMATVYLAHDRRHSRRVAVKVLHAELAAILGAERFLAEIRTTASLQHPHILPLFESGQANGQLFYVMPFVEGETLRARLVREGPLPIADAVRIASEVADALDYAHRHGVVHRDVKPENVLLAGSPGDSRGGHALVADFGIALAVTQAGGERMTQTGLSLGTPQYMPPEQAAGERLVDARADVYALGAVTYEMLAGEPPFTAPTVQGVIARLMTEAPRRLSTVRRSVPPAVDVAVDRALEKLPGDRFASTRDFADALRAPSTIASDSDSLSDGRPLVRRVGGKRRRAVTVVIPWAAFAAAVALAGYAWTRAPAGGNEPVARFDLALVGDPSGVTGPLSSIALSPDGSTIAFVATSERQIILRRLDDLQITPVPGTGGAGNLAYSPDGKSIAFVAREKLRVVRLADRAITSVLDIPLGENLSLAWLGDAEIVVPRKDPAHPTRPVLVRIPAAGGQPRRLCRPNDSIGERDVAYPYPLRGRDIVLYTSVGVNESADRRLAACDTKRGTTRLLGESGREIVGVLENRLIFVRSDGTLMGVAFDERSARLRGEPTRLIDGIKLNITRASVALSGTGTLAYVTGSPLSQPVLVSKESTPMPLGVERRAFGHPRFSPDGRRIAIDIIGADNTDVWVYDTVSRTVTRLTSNGNNDRAEWTPDGRRVVFLSDREDNRSAIWWQPADGSGGAEKVFASAYSIREAVPTPDGQALIFREDHPQRRRDIYLLPLRGSRSPEPILATEADELMPRLSPDGHWLAYQSDESGRPEIYLRSFPGSGARVQVSVNGGTEPMWARDGRRLFYRSNRSVIAASLQASQQAGPNVTARDVVADGDYLPAPYYQNYDVTPDGRKLLMLTSSANGVRFVVVINWLRELRAKVP